MNYLEKIKYYRQFDVSLIDEMIENGSFDSISSEELNILFLNVDDLCKCRILENGDLFSRVLSILPNQSKRSIVDFVSDFVRDKIFSSPFLEKVDIHKENIFNYLKRLKIKKFVRYLDCDSLNHLYDVDIIDEVTSCYGSDLDFINMISSSLKNGKFKKISLLQIHNVYELFIYTKFSFLVSVSSYCDGYLIIGGDKVSYDDLKMVNSKHFCTLLSLGKSFSEDISYEELFVTIFKIYTVFGFDNSRKLLNGFFSRVTDASIRRASCELFKERRQEFRIKNQDKFYYHGMEQVFLNAFFSYDFDYFKKFCMRDDSYVTNFLNDVSFKLKGLNDLDCEWKVKNIIDEEIKNRDSYFLGKCREYYLNHCRKKDISLHDLYSVFRFVVISPSFSLDGKVIVDEEMIKFLLGNCKRDNDCLVRMVLNEEALGLNTELYKVINHFNEIKDIISRASYLSLYSILDVTSVLKAFFYDLKPDELDISLPVLSKILSSREYCTESGEEILRRTFDLHKRRKWKNSCVIPFLSGNIGDVSYRVVSSLSDSLLTCGIDSGSCFKVGGKGEGFFDFCLTSPLGGVLEVIYLGVTYILPFSVNYNMLNINSIDPRITDSDVYFGLMKEVEIISSLLIEQVHSVDVVTITDVHHERFFRKSDYSTLEIPYYLPLNTDVYSDYNKNEISNYVIYAKDSFKKISLEVCYDLFFCDRMRTYMYFSDCGISSFEVSKKINQIAYSSIEFMNISEEMKSEYRNNFVHFNTDDFLYIVGNVDWFIGVDCFGQFCGFCLPYDKRGVYEYQLYKENVLDTINAMNKKKVLK